MMLKEKLKKFFSTKYNFICKNNYKNENVLMVDRERIDATIINSIISYAVSVKYKSNIILL